MQEKEYYKVVDDLLTFLYKRNYTEEEKQVQRRILYILNNVCKDKERFEETVKVLKKENII